ncbi:MAG TPA: hypothetical protein VIM28_07145 [Solirubrobacterales bacterium]
MAGSGLKALIGMIGVSACFAGVAYAATQSHGRTDSPDRKTRSGRPAKPALSEHPDAQSPSTRARFGFTARKPTARFECHLDRARWRICRSPVLFAGLTVGRHKFAVRAVDRQRRHSATARFRWTVLAAKDFSIVPDLSGLSALYPGAPPLALPLTVQNPNPAPILVTGLRVSVSADPVGCASADNLALGQSSASRSTPLEVPAGGSVRLPAHGVLPPTIQLRELPVNQDACKNARFPLEFTGSARG